jgi:hypothetical protein
MAGDPGEVRSLLEKKHVVEGPDQRNRFILGFIIHLCIIIPELHNIYIHNILYMGVYIYVFSCQMVLKQVILRSNGH